MVVFAAALVGAPAALASVPAAYTVSGFADGSPGTCSSPVGTTESCTTLRAAVAAANTNMGDPTITLGAGRYVLGGTGGTNSALEIETPMTIAGAGATKTTIVQTDGADGVVDVEVPPPGAAINGVEITGGAQGGIFNAYTLTLSGDMIDHNSATGSSGTATENGGAIGGGGIQNNGTLTVEGSTITENTATGGSGGPSSGATEGGGGGQARGGGIDSGGSLTVTDSTISDNTAQGGRGGSTVNATAGGGDNALGGGLDIGGNAVLEGDTITGNHVIGGSGGDATGTGSPGGASGGFGGGIDLESNSQATTYVIVDTTITGNAAAGGNPGSAPGGSGGLEAADGEGGGLSLYELGKATVASDTLVDNTASGGGGNVFVQGQSQTPATQSLTISDSLIASGSGQSEDANCYLSSHPHVVDGGLNLEDSSASESECGFNTTDDRLISPGTAGVATTPANNGGPTETLALEVGSPALGAGGACKDPANGGAELLVDQRGEPRPASGPCDIGAFQVQPVTQGTAEVTGTAEIGGTLTCAPSGFGVDVLAYTYQWLVNGVAVKGATGTTLKLTPADGGLDVYCRISASGARGQAAATSPATPIAGYGVPTVKSKKNGVSKSGTVSIPIVCGGADTCTATIKLTVTERGKAVSAVASKRRRGGKARLLALGSKSFTIPHGKTTTVTVALHGSALNLFKKHERGLPALATLSYWHLGKLVSPGRKVTLVSASKRSHHH